MLTPGIAWDRIPPLVMGDDRFRAQITAALELLAACVPDWSGLVDQVDLIRPVEPEDPPLSYAGLLIRPGGTIVALAERALVGPTDAAYLASLLVHEAAHAAQWRRGQRYYGRRAEQAAWSLQAACLAQLAPDHPHLDWLYRSLPDLPESAPLPGNPEV